MGQKLSAEAYANKKRYIREYDKTHSKIYTVKMRYGKDDDILEYIKMNSDKSVQELIRMGLRALMK